MEEKIGAFYSTLDNTKKMQSQKITIIMGDLNIKVGKKQNGEIVSLD